MKKTILHVVGPSNYILLRVGLVEKGFQKHVHTKKKIVLLVKLLGLIHWTKINKKCPSPVLDWFTYVWNYPLVILVEENLAQYNVTNNEVHGYILVTGECCGIFWAIVTRQWLRSAW
jgi:hypothetical protein